MFGIKLKRTQGKTWANAKSEDFLTDKFLKKIGKLLVDSIIYEARKDLAKQGNAPTPAGIPEGIPNSENFFKSFAFQVKGTSIEIYSTWPFIEQITEGRKAYPMEWLTQAEGVSKVPMKGPRGTVLIKTTPKSTREAWIHPGFRKHNFIRRGYERARKQMEEMLAKQVMEGYLKLPIV